MDKQEFVGIRKELGKTQKQMAELLGTSLKAIHSYEQGWRNVPVHVERQVFFLLSKRRTANQKKSKPCWRVKKCPSDRKKACPAWEFQSGTTCWFVNGTICEGMVQNDWEKKMETCRSCEVFAAVVKKSS